MTTTGGSQSLEAWALVRQMLDDMMAMVQADAETELELLEGLRVLGRITALCSELSLDVDHAHAVVLQHEQRGPLRRRAEPRRRVPPRDDRRRAAATASAARAARAPTSASRCWPASGLTPRRMAAHLSDRDLDVGPDGRFGFVLAATKPSEHGAGRPPVGGGPRGRVGHRRARVRRRPGRRGAGRARRSTRSTRRHRPRSPTDDAARRAAHRHGVDDRQAGHPPPHHQARAARAAQRARHGRGGASSARRTRRPTTST